MIVWFLVALALLIILLTSVLNAFTFPRLKTATQGERKKISILIPARNEAQVIENTIRHLLAQEWDHYEVILLDDHSNDDTAERARQAAQGDPRLKVISGQPLPSGWLGKNWACHQLSQAAQGDVLIFTDADVEWDASALPALISLHRDMLTVWPTQITLTWAERLCVSAIALAIIGYLPEIMVRKSPFSAFAAANGQCLVFTRDAYETVGGHEAVRDQIVEDVALAKRIKRAGKTLTMLEGNRLIRCRMYHNWQEVRDGFAKNILAGHGNRLMFLAVSTGFHWAVFILPWVWLLVGRFVHLGDYWPVFPFVLIAAGILVRAISLRITHQRVGDAFLMPLTVLLMTRIAAQSVWWQIRHGGPRWKGRVFVKGT